MLDDVEVKTHVTQLLNAGSETTGKTLAGLLTFSRRELYVEVRDDRSRLLPAISETLRFTPPSQLNSRKLTEDVELHAVRMPAGSLVLVLIASANRDEERSRVHPHRFVTDASRCRGRARKRLRPGDTEDQTVHGRSASPCPSELSHLRSARNDDYRIPLRLGDQLAAL